VSEAQALAFDTVDGGKVESVAARGERSAPGLIVGDGEEDIGAGRLCA
jgi:hypothetical protein